MGLLHNPHNIKFHQVGAIIIFRTRNQEVILLHDDASSPPGMNKISDFRKHESAIQVKLLHDDASSEIGKSD